MSPSSGRLSAKEDPPCQYPDDSMRALAQEPRKSLLDEHWRQSEYRLVHSSRAQALEPQVPPPGNQRQKLAGRPDGEIFFPIIGPGKQRLRRTWLAAENS